jgi:hypothetical protein
MKKMFGIKDGAVDQNRGKNFLAGLLYKSNLADVDKNKGLGKICFSEKESDLKNLLKEFNQLDNQRNSFYGRLITGIFGIYLWR